MELLEGKLRDLTEQLDRQYEISKSADRRAKRMEGDYLSLEGRLRRVEDDAHSGEVLRDELRHDKERVNIIFVSTYLCYTADTVIRDVIIFCSDTQMANVAAQSSTGEEKMISKL